MSSKVNADSAGNSFVVFEHWDTDFVIKTQDMCKNMSSTFMFVAWVH